MDPRPDTISRVSWILRIGASMEFIGHGALGIQGIAAWTSYFAVVGIHRETALSLMPLVGMWDVALGIAILVYPVRGVVLFMAAWGLWTAILRPLAGESVWEAVERAGNFGALYALFLLARKGGADSWMRFEFVGDLGGLLRRQVGWVLRLTTALLLLGHGALGLLVRKPLLALQYAQAGVHASWVVPLVGGIECALALAVLFQPGYGLLLFVVGWKLATEALSPLAGSPIWVFIEHGGSYAAPLALAVIMGKPRDVPESRQAVPA
jgi:hypothetical protein